jgi:hypothetical protein
LINTIPKRRLSPVSVVPAQLARDLQDAPGSDDCQHRTWD